MGVHGLWDLLAPVGRRVSVETLSAKKLAIDASIWMVQFMKAMRDEKGEMVRNAHILGFFRRICKLLYLRTKPVFVFDGGTPALKRRTVIARRRQRENAQAKIRKTAEKLLLNQLKSMRLKELAKDLENQRKMNKDDVTGKEGGKSKKVASDQTDTPIRNQEKDDVISESCRDNEVHEMQAASVWVEETGNLNNNASTSTSVFPSVAEEDSEGEEEDMILPEMDDNVDPAILAALPPSLQQDLLMRGRTVVEGRNNSQLVREYEKQENIAKGKELLSDLTNTERCNIERGDILADGYNQEKLDEMLAASLAAEEERNFSKNPSTSAAPITSDEEGGDGDEDEEMILPVHGKVDPSILAALPPSVQLDLLVQMRERLMAENRQRYQTVKKAPEKFSELQIQAYLKTVAFRREIDEVQKAAGGKVVDGVQTSRIASEANREFIFSSSFSGDKQSLASSGVQRNGDKQQQRSTVYPSFQSMDNVTSFSRSNSGAELASDVPDSSFDDSVETYLDERGRTRVSRVRALGMRMTRDLQRNLDLMKEIEQEQTQAMKTATKVFPREKQPVKVSHDKSADPVYLNKGDGESLLNNETSRQISFEVDGSKCFDSDDDMFTRLASGQPVELSSVSDKMANRQCPDSASDSDWEEGVIDGKGDRSLENVAEINQFLEVNNISDDSEVEWEEGVCDDPKSPLCPVESEKPVSKGYLEEEADLQEAIRISLKDFEDRKFNNAFSEQEKVKTSEAENSSESLRGNNVDGSNKSEEDFVQNRVLSKTQDIEKQDEVGWTDKMVMPRSKLLDRELGSSPIQSSEDLGREMLTTESVANLVAESIPLFVEESSDSLAKHSGTSTSAKICFGENTRTSRLLSSGLPSSKLANDRKSDVETEPSVLVNKVRISAIAESSTDAVKIRNSSLAAMDSSMIGSTNQVPVEQKLAREGNSENEFGRREHGTLTVGYDENMQAKATETELEEEMLLLEKEYRNLGEEQRKLERNADSVSSEMFAECQELLQMFGLPYIIAPMEAEAQCAYMEVANLVDGIVTDDSDVFLFGARNVYKNIFDDRKYVETYFMKDIEKELGLTREKLIRMALLLGSDYTEGVSGIGIVNAIEVVNAFPEEAGLHKFREWVESPDPTILGEFGAQNGPNARKRGSKHGDDDTKGTKSNTEGSSLLGNSIPEVHEQEQSTHDVLEIKQMFMDKHRNVSKNWHVPPSFPSEAVISAYSSPQVDKSAEPFSWGKPDLHVLQRLCWEKFGWGVQKSNELLLPVLKEYNKHETQLRLEAFYTFNERFAKIRSKRIKKAVKGITGNQSADFMDDAVEEVSKARKKRKVIGSQSDDGGTDKPRKTTKDCDPVNKSTLKQTRKRRAPNVPISTEEEKKEQQVEGGKFSGTYRRVTGKGRGRGTGRGKGKRSISSEQSDSSGDVNEGYDVEEVHVASSELLQERRRSMRLRKPASYTESDLENLDIESVDHGRKSSDEEVVEEDLSSLPRACQNSGGGDAENEAPEVEEFSFEKFSGDYIENEGEFCANEGEVGQSGWSQNSHPCEADVSKDYLKTGGGFCEEDETETEGHGGAYSPPTDAARNDADSCPPCGLREEAQQGNSGGSLQGTSSIISSRTSNELQRGEGDTSDLDATERSLAFANASSSSLPESNKNMSAAEASSDSGVLRAMPFLKRKKRKN